jgi:hypothetical protein
MKYTTTFCSLAYFHKLSFYHLATTNNLLRQHGQDQRTRKKKKKAKD